MKEADAVGPEPGASGFAQRFSLIFAAFPTRLRR
jgi:hypothetical protein